MAELSHHSLEHDGEYVFAIDPASSDAEILMGTIIVVDPDDPDARAYYRVTSVGESTITATPFTITEDQWRALT